MTHVTDYNLSFDVEFNFDSDFNFDLKSNLEIIFKVKIKYNRNFLDKFNLKIELTTETSRFWIFSKVVLVHYPFFSI